MKKQLLALPLLLLAGSLAGDTYPPEGPYSKWGVETVTLSSAQILALDTTPIRIIPALGADCHQMIHSYVLRKPAGTAYANIAAGDDIAIETTTGVLQESIETTGFLDQATEQQRAVRGAAITYTATSFNLPIQLRLLGPITTGTSSLQITYVFYRDCAS